MPLETRPLAGKTVLVTGASRGIGRAVAVEMAARGAAAVALVYAASDDAAGEAAAAVRAHGAKAAAYRCSVADFAAVGEAAAQVQADFGGVDILVNNAGITRDSLLLNMSEEDFDAVLNVNLKGAFNMTHHLYRQFARRRSGRIINISSVVGLCGNAGQANYAASKAGLIGFTKSVAKELAARGVTCNAIAPGFICSDMTSTLPEKTRDDIMHDIPAQRFGAPEEVAKLAVFLASDESAYITGQVIGVDGGMAM